MSDYDYLPLTPGFFAILVGLFLGLLLLARLGFLRNAYLQLGLSPGALLWLLAGSLVGSYFNIPVAEISAERVVAGTVVDFYGVAYRVPMLLDRPGTIIAVNVGGAAIPALVSVYLLVRHEIWLKGAVAVAAVSLFVYWLATPVPGFGIAVPVFAPAIVTSIVAALLTRERAAPLAYVAGSLGTLIGADLFNLGAIGALGAPIMSIGGSGTFDGIFLTGIAAMLLASFYARPAPQGARSAD